MSAVDFLPQERSDIFDELEKKFYNRNFGKASKSEIELLMFHFYISKLIKIHQNPDGTIDYRKCSDYRIACDLGLTPQQVRNLKVKSHMAYPIQFDWHKSLAQLITHGKKNRDGDICVPIPDPVLFLAIQNYLEEHNTFSTETLTTKYLTLSPEDFIDLALATENEKIQEKCEKMLKPKKLEGSIWDSEHKVRSLVKAGLTLAEIIADLTQCVGPASIVSRVAQGIKEFL